MYVMRVPREPRICVGCGARFVPNSRNQRACKPSCRQMGSGVRRRPLDALLEFGRDAEPARTRSGGMDHDT
jgi:hypothetical protein